jgi:CO dehydrogenase/acetyl-CoA synthase delta subunit
MPGASSSTNAMALRKGWVVEDYNDWLPKGNKWLAYKDLAAIF